MKWMNEASHPYENFYPFYELDSMPYGYNFHSIERSGDGASWPSIFEHYGDGRGY